MITKKNIVYDKWLSEIIGKDSYTLTLDDEFIALSEENGTEEKQWIHSIHNNNDPLFVQTKVSTQSTDYIKYLEGVGFFLVDTNVTLKKDIDSDYCEYIKPDFSEINIRFAKITDRKETISVASKSFIYSRFHLDPWFSNNIANRIKAKWASNYFDGNRGDQMVVALNGNTIVGFLQILKPEEDNFIIDLIAVIKECQRKGIAVRMIDYAICENNGICNVTVGTQIGNIPSFKLYQKMKFFLENSTYVFHLHRD
tara:strand:+ start:2466 stop:3227 length:762 start_codon:yes stop_codon:yes gene_type:complete